MMYFTLERQNHMDPSFEMLDAMRRGLEMTIASDFESIEFDWNGVVDAIVPFQFKDGSFNLLDSYRIESDCRVYYCHEATYICTALLMKALLVDPSILDGKERDILPAAMHMCCARNLGGHGFDGLKGKLKAINYFIKCDVATFLKEYPDMCPEFTLMIQNIEQQFALRVENEEFLSGWGEDYETDIRAVHEYFGGSYVFVYGTLMEGQVNHSRYLTDKQYVGAGELSGYDMFDLGSYPGIVRGKGLVSGEIYHVSDADLKALDQLEGEGILYKRESKGIQMESGEYLGVYVYVYNRSAKGFKRITGRYSG